MRHWYGHDLPHRLFGGPSGPAGKSTRDQRWRFALMLGAISDRIAEIDNGADADEGEMAALTGEGYQFFVPHGQAIAVCRDKIAGGE